MSKFFTFGRQNQFVLSVCQWSFQGSEHIFAFFGNVQRICRASFK